MRVNKSSEDVAPEPCLARVDDANGTCLGKKIFKRNFVLQKSVAVQFF